MKKTEQKDIDTLRKAIDLYKMLCVLSGEITPDDRKFVDLLEADITSVEAELVILKVMEKTA